eukprot:CAMPEP_0116878588 /NCGR_PEP_ID=MMETSP0463-20121206/10330_1 /TAXON_ID=181622 /ORGANISM="Strombidinopsis sp, Strain SopsisLIS2011" /LENGTH=92 /DNA_ID=CAMNT_0004526943 /DNA_START=327 /DNA_END=606 /DNA_ORIENTATION=+
MRDGKGKLISHDGSSMKASGVKTKQTGKEDSFTILVISTMATGLMTSSTDTDLISMLKELFTRATGPTISKTAKELNLGPMVQFTQEHTRTA